MEKEKTRLFILQFSLLHKHHAGDDE